MLKAYSGICRCCDDNAMIVAEDCAVGPVCRDCRKQLRRALEPLALARLIFCNPHAECHESRALVLDGGEAA